MSSLLLHLKRLDWILIVSALLLVSIGLLSLCSSSLGREDFSNFKKQIFFFLVGFFLMLLISFFDWRIFSENSSLILVLYFLCLALLIGLFFFAPEIRGVKSWYKLGRFSFDPIEPTKIVLILLLAKYFSKRHVEMYKIRHILLSGLYILAPIILIFLHPDFGSVILLLFIWIGILLISGIKIRHFLILSLVFLLLFSLTWTYFLIDYQKERVSAFLFPQIDPLGQAWSQTQAKIAIGSGGILGQGIAGGSQTQYGFLPEPQTDFIFAAIAEEFGLCAVGILLFLFVLFFWRILKIALKSESNFPRLFVGGFAILIFSQIFINIGMNLGLLPVIGISLPLVSYGGSNLIFTFLGLGILQNIKASK